MELIFTPTDFVAVLNQTLEYAYPLVTIEGELSQVRVSRGRWVYFDIKDETASLRCFGNVYGLPGPIEDGMTVRIVAAPRVHPQYSFSLNFQSVTPVGQGSLKRAADLLKAKLEKEGLFDPSRKRPLPFAPESIGLIASKESAAYGDFVKIMDERWGGVRIVHRDTQVQGDAAPAEIVQAIEVMNQLAAPPEALVITRGGGSADDLAAFSNESVVRAVASSRIPTLVAIGHEVDLSLAELAADLRASTPSNAAQLLTPDKHQVLQAVTEQRRNMAELLKAQLTNAQNNLKQAGQALAYGLQQAYALAEQTLSRQVALLHALDPQAALKRGYAVIRAQGKVIKSVSSLRPGERIDVQLHDGRVQATVENGG